MVVVVCLLLRSPSPVMCIQIIKIHCLFLYHPFSFIPSSYQKIPLLLIIMMVHHILYINYNNTNYDDDDDEEKIGVVLLILLLRRPRCCALEQLHHHHNNCIRCHRVTFPSLSRFHSKRSGRTEKDI